MLVHVYEAGHDGLSVYVEFPGRTIDARAAGHRDLRDSPTSDDDVDAFVALAAFVCDGTSTQDQSLVHSTSLR